MIDLHSQSVLLTVAIYLLLAFSFYGWGRVLVWSLGKGRGDVYSFTLIVWLGWAVSLLIFQLLHFFFPVNFYLVSPVLSLGGIFTLLHVKPSLRHRSLSFSAARWLISALMLVMALSFMCWVAARSMLPPTNYDSGLYHFNVIRWINTYPVVPGLGNLHGRLAFNKSFFTYAAAVEFYPYFRHARSVANSFLLILTYATFIEFLLPAIKRPHLLVGSHLCRYIPAFVLTPSLLYLTVYSNGLSSPTPDLTSSLLQLVLFVVLARCCAFINIREHRLDIEILFLVFLAATLLTIKLSNAAFSVFIFAGVLLLTRNRTHSRIAIKWAIFFSTLLVIVWCTHGVLLSGAPLFPSTFGYVETDWAVPKDEIEGTAKAIYAFARQPDVHWKKVPDDWSWFNPWLARMLEKYKRDEMVIPLSLSLIIGILSLVISRWSKRSLFHQAEAVLILPPLAGVFFWFFTAPDLRFANAIFFILPASTILLFLAIIKPLISKRLLGWTMILMVLVVDYKTCDRLVKSYGVYDNVSTSSWYPIREAELTVKSTLSGLELYIPLSGNQCWDSPLPCTPNFNPELRLREEKNLASGFKIK